MKQFRTPVYGYRVAQLISDYLNLYPNKDNYNLIFDTEYQVLSNYSSFESSAYLLNSYDWEEKFFDNFVKAIEPLLGVMEPWNPKQLDEGMLNPFVNHSLVPSIVYEFNFEKEDVENGLAPSVFVKTLFAHLWDVKACQHQREIHKDMQNFCLRVKKSRDEKATKFGFVIDKDAINHFETPFLKLFAKYLVQVTDIHPESAEEICKKIENPEPVDVDEFICNLFSELEGELNMTCEKDKYSEKISVEEFFKRHRTLYIKL